MTRTALLSSSLFVAACTVGEIDDVATDAPPNAALCVERLADPQLDAHAHLDGTGTHAGENCVTTACHGDGGLGPKFQFAGTVFKLDGTTPNAGVTIRVKSMGGMVASGVTDKAGNFNIIGGTLPMAFPATTDATACPTVTPMISSLAQGGGDCNSCHRAGGIAGGVITLADP
jgi:hypothetical protein